MITQMDHPASFIHKVTGEIKARNKWDLESERERKGQECERLSVAH